MKKKKLKANEKPKKKTLAEVYRNAASVLVCLQPPQSPPTVKAGV